MKIKDGALTTTVSDTTPVMAYDEWMAEGKWRFGEDFNQWRFVCPVCKNVAAVGDYKPFKDQGANPNSAYQECIGRYTKSAFKAFGHSTKERGQPCDYALYGLFRFPGVIVETADGVKLMAFAFEEYMKADKENNNETNPNHL
jgi:hypothetical protein